MERGRDLLPMSVSHDGALYHLSPMIARFAASLYLQDGVALWPADIYIGCKLISCGFSIKRELWRGVLLWLVLQRLGWTDDSLACT